ncbi:Uncharacterised protein [Actinobaculum suis]|uniref:DUF4417 domain-containing protein n=3 Tax=Actinobaculum suis TaxID=1657 RepID=A0A7Z8Y7Q3_9ACTO|nr:Uncharacterised protein [Actinobaculum suis]
MSSSRCSHSEVLQAPLPNLVLPEHMGVLRTSNMESRTITPSKDWRDVGNWRLLNGLKLARPYDIPIIEGCEEVPEFLEVFSETTRGGEIKPGTWVHFYEDDQKFVRFWNNPEKYLPRLSEYSGVVSPDFSTYENLPICERMHATYKNQLLGAWLERNGVQVIPNVRLTGRESVSYALAGVPSSRTLAVGTHGCIKKSNSMHQFREEISLICRLKMPTDLVVYGCLPRALREVPLELGIPVHVFSPDTWQRSKNRGVA